MHRLDEGTDCLLEWGALFSKGKSDEQMVSRKFESETPHLDVTFDSTQGRDRYIDDPYVPGDQGYHPLLQWEQTCLNRTQGAQEAPKQPVAAGGASAEDMAIPSRAAVIARRVSAGGGGPPEPPPKDKLCDHCLQVQPCPCPQYDQHDTHECPCDHWNSQREKEKHEQ